MNDTTPQRILALDALRGIAVLGILLLNISGFALFRVASFNPLHGGEVTTSERITWMLLNLFAQGKFLFIFALLFGGTLFLLLKRGTRWNYCRLAVLLLIGVFHTLFIWEGDILFPYSVCGMLVLVFIKTLSMKAQLRLGIGLYLIGAMVLALLFYYYRQFADVVWYSSIYTQNEELGWKTGDYLTSVVYRGQELSSFMFNLVRQYSWFLFGAMLMGSALMASGWLQQRFSRHHYGVIAAWFLAVSLTLQTLIVLVDNALDWHFVWSAMIAQPLTMLIQVFQSLGYIALLYWLWPKIQHRFFAYAMRCVGKMALTIYLMQSVMGIIIFQRIGLFNQFTLLELMPFVLIIWLINITFAVCWLRYFQQGPMEWLWRKATHELAQRV